MAGDEEVSYREIAPHPLLRQHIYCYWELQSKHPFASAYNFRAVSDGCTDIVIGLSRPNSFIVGFSNEYSEIPISYSFHCMGVRFLPTAFTSLYGIPASLMTNSMEFTQDVLPDLYQRVRLDICTQQPLGVRIRLLDSYFLDCLNNHSQYNDSRMTQALYQLLVGINEPCRLYMEPSLVSDRQMRRLFQYYLGDSPKSFSRILRFQHALRTGDSSAYYDQSHFIRDFHRFAGDIPSLLPQRQLCII